MVSIGWRARRLGQSIFTVWAVTTLSFVLVRLMPGNPMGAMITQLEQRGVNPARAQQLVQLRLSVDPSKPIPIAYVEYLGHMLQGQLGVSAYYQLPVAKVLANGIPWTLFVLSWSVFISFFIGIAVGALMAYWEGGKLDIGLTSWAILMGSVPFYVLAILLLIFFAYRWHIFPVGGRAPTGVTAGFNLPYIIGIVRHATLPILSMLVASGVASLGMRGNSIRVLGSDYLRVARLRGLSDITISTQYVARNAVLPMYTSLLISIGEMFGGSAVLEHVFQYQGIGYFMLSATYQRDYPLMMGGFVLLTVAIVLALLFADLTYSLIDPRAGSQSSEAY